MEQSFLLKKELADKVAEITDVDYYGRLELKDIEEIIKDLINAYHILEEKYDDKVEYCMQYHKEKEFNSYEEYGISPRDFI